MHYHSLLPGRRTLDTLLWEGKRNSSKSLSNLSFRFIKCFWSWSLLLWITSTKRNHIVQDRDFAEAILFILYAQSVKWLTKAVKKKKRKMWRWFILHELQFFVVLPTRRMGNTKLPSIPFRRCGYLILHIYFSRCIYVVVHFCYGSCQLTVPVDLWLKSCPAAD